MSVERPKAVSVEEAATDKTDRQVIAIAIGMAGSLLVLALTALLSVNPMYGFALLVAVFLFESSIAFNEKIPAFLAIAVIGGFTIF